MRDETNNSSKWVGKWKNPDEELPISGLPVIVSCKEERDGFVIRRTTSGWRTSHIINEGAWIVDNTVVFNVEAWMFFPMPYEE